MQLDYSTPAAAEKPFPTPNPPPWVLNPPTVNIEPYLPTSYAPACGASEF